MGDSPLHWHCQALTEPECIAIGIGIGLAFPLQHVPIWCDD